MRREVPLALTMIFGIFMILEFFVRHPFITNIGSEFQQWTIIVAAAAIVLGVLNVARIHANKIRTKKKDWPYSIFLIVGLVVMALLGIVRGIGEQSFFNYLYINAYVPMQGTMFSLLAFYIASAAFRAFRIRKFEAGLLAIVAVIVMIGRVPIGAAIWDRLPGITSYIMDYPNLAAKRAILIGAALGAISTGMKVVLGIERNVLGGGS
ncbi:MAG: hypothetical protein KJ970_05305 [Candidatus Eisenbacteria bacterium]|uniref:Uncharacterized protein n=1 Tax=Eiseniibacteriota bacterium TaxID=2212470 RepID=A0A948RWJ4_UNCEI|nr:hypothetical protein [Candidatus Eisenbacteria bacterium]MBU1947667.1 hypothetical protein [Candidatus Eisenbacteria bacterium]MBU2690327.1 hypothetical protein [Candidatus Eisenbacteria bacterium]